MLADAPFNTLTREIIGGAIEVHRALKPGLLETAYQMCLQYELAARRLHFVTQRRIPLVYKELKVDAAYRIDLLVEDRVVVEVKSLEQLLPIHQAQALTYLVLTECPVGLLINFNVAKLTDGVRRLINPRVYPNSRS